MNILVTGANGQLGSEIKELASLYDTSNFFFTDIDQLDICNLEEVKTYIKFNNINAIINCAAYTNVDKSESDQENALKVNSKAIRNLIDSIATVTEGKLIHISTDYVFDGNSNVPYDESFQTNPINFYGESKRNGEEYVENSALDTIVIRTSWLYSVYGNNFVKTMLHLGESKDSLSVIYDQIGSPTNAKDLAKVSLDILFSKERIDTFGKIYHYSNEGVASWYDFASEIMDMAGLDCIIKPILTRNYPETPAKRPHYSVLSKEKIKSDFNVIIPHWKQSLVDCVNKLKKK